MFSDKDELSFIVTQKEIKIRKSWGNIDPVTKIKPHKKKHNQKREKNNIRKMIDEAFNDIDD